MPELGAIACGHPITASAAEEMLREGGNAFDAAIAAQFAACVVEPVLASLGGGGFLLAHPVDATACVYDFFVQTPCHKRDSAELDFFPIHADFGTTTQEFHIGLGSTATPGSVAGMFEIHRDLGSLPMSRIIEPAVRAARGGVRVNELQASIFDIVKPIYLAKPEARTAYDDLREGHLLCQPALAETLEALGREGSALFYAGEIGASLVRLCADSGGHLGSDDLRDYAVMRRKPLALAYRDAQVLTNPPPSAGGILIGCALALMSERDISRAGFGSAEHLATLVEAMHLTSQARVDLLAHADRTGELDAGLLARYRQQVLKQPRFNRGTTHISIVDKAGNVAAMTLSNGEGCGTLIPGTGVMLNNMLGEEDINPGSLGDWASAVRMTSMMAPTIVERGSDWRAALGSGGSNRIRTAILQVVSNLIDFSDQP
ncbi:MAG: gamma-glutamyltransferase, partial [Gammaproteobacteria bacterium]|nr:gamma-glutamyltransferase [Gammaproteobacteria bacterium]